MTEQKPGIKEVSIRKMQAGRLTTAPDKLAIEEPLEIRLTSPGGMRKVSITMRTPGQDHELAIGFLFTEGIIRSADELVSWAAEGESVMNIHTRTEPELKSMERNFYTTSSCGVCGKASIESISTHSIYQKSDDALRVPAELLCRLPGILREKQRIFEDTGGLHASAVFDTEGHLLLLREDVGRHNALDKLIGASLLSGGLPLDRHILLLSGRASFELVQKATMAGIKMVAAVGAPSSLAVSMAAEAGMTLLGFLRDNRFNIYSGSKRILHENED